MQSTSLISGESGAMSVSTNNVFDINIMDCDELQEFCAIYDKKLMKIKQELTVLMNDFDNKKSVVKAKENFDLTWAKLFAFAKRRCDMVGNSDASTDEKHNQLLKCKSYHNMKIEYDATYSEYLEKCNKAVSLNTAKSQPKVADISSHEPETRRLRERELLLEKRKIELELELNSLQMQNSFKGKYNSGENDDFMTLSYARGSTCEDERKQNKSYCGTRPKVSQNVSPPRAREWWKPASKDDESVKSMGNKSDDSTTTISARDFSNAMEKGFQVMANTIQQGFTLPKRSLMRFDGNPLDFFDFMSSFDENIGDVVKEPVSKLSYLMQMCDGEARAAIKKCTLIKPPSKGYNTARQILKNRFGQEEIVCTAYMEKLTDRPQLKPGDFKGLSEYATLMRDCEITLCEWGYEDSLNNQENLGNVFKKLPRYLQLQFHTNMSKKILKGNKPTYSDMVDFIEESVLMSNTMFGRIVSKSKPKGTNSGEYQSSRKSRNKYFVKTHATDTNVKSDSTVSDNKFPICFLCNADHAVWKCDVFKNKSVKEREDIVKQNKMCYNCFSRRHMVRDCKSKYSCRCGKRHHNLLHRERDGEHASGSSSSSPGTSSSEGARNSSDNEQVTTGGITSLNNVTEKGHVRLKVLPVRVWSKENNRQVETYAFLDEGSTSTLCSVSLKNKLGVKGRKQSYEISTVNGSKETKGYSISLRVQGCDERKHVKLTDVLTVTDLPEYLSECVPTDKDVKRYKHLKDLKFHEITNKKVELLIGADFPEMHEIYDMKKGKRGQLKAVRTVLGWTLSGCESGKSVSRSVHLNIVNFGRVSLQQQMTELFNKDFVETKDELCHSVEDKYALCVMESKCQKINGHFQVGMPWHSTSVKLPNNRVMAEKRCEYLKKRFLMNPELYEKYKEKIKSYLQCDYARRIPTNELLTTERTWYLPHHSTGPKFRVVFDCGAEFKGTSLNKALLSGPDLTNSLLGVLLRFRQNYIAVMADISAMFHQVRVTKEDSDSLRFLWWEESDIDRPLVDHQMLVHPFGATSSPSCAAFALKQIVKNNQDKCDKRVLDTIDRSMYVDDLMFNEETREDAVKILTEVSMLLKDGGFALAKYRSNDPVIQHKFQEKLEVKDIDLKIGSEKTPETALGVVWDTVQDCFKFKINVKPKPATRRGILSMSGQIYDPIGFVQPFLLPVKLLLQSLCKDNIGWDEAISSEAESKWNKWLSGVESLSEITIPRCMKPKGKIRDMQIHHFCDASETGIGVVSYVRSTSAGGNISVSFLLGKSKVAPVKPVSIPRLELSSAVIAVKVDKLIKQELDYVVNSVHFWTDSTCVLRYIANQSTRFRTYVANRLAVIHDGSDASQWHHVPSKCNPADIGSRGLMPEDVSKSKLWFDGPECLYEEPKYWPVNPNLEKIQDDPEVKEVITVAVNVVDNSVNESANGLSELLRRYSSFYKLQKSVAWLRRFKIFIKNKYGKCCTKGDVQKGYLTVDELEESTCDIVKIVQKETMQEAVKQMNKYNHESLNGKFQSLPKKILRKCPGVKNLCKLCPVFVKGVLRVGGRLQKSCLSNEEKYPIILPANHHVTNLIVKNCHVKEGHAGVLQTLSSLREKFWIIKGYTTTRKELNKCLKCRVRNSKPGAQLMANLPKCRVTMGTRPFEHTGVDYMGPVLVKLRRSQVKRYVCVFTCMATRAVHLELVHSLDTDSCIQAIMRFSCRRGRPSHIYSDNGTNFIGTNRELRESIQNWNQSLINSRLRQNAIQWHFNPPRASHQGGIWERIIRSVRRILSDLVGEFTLDDENLHTCLLEVERILNSRPLTPVVESSEDFQALTPNDLLLGKMEDNLPPGEFVKADGYRKSWKKIQILTDNFWSRWKKEYIPMLQERSKWQAEVLNFQVGDLVLLSCENTKRGDWPKAIVEEIYPDQDGVVRCVRVKTTQGSYTRDIRKLCPLEAKVIKD